MKSQSPRVLSADSGNEMSVVIEAAEVLKAGALCVIPTDTVYGLAADPRVPGTEARVYEAKNRAGDKPLPLLASSVRSVEEYGARLTELERRLARKFWPGAMTLILPVDGDSPGRAGTHPQQCGAGIVEGFRVPACDITLMLLREVGWPLRTTSANRSGQPPALTAAEAVRSLGPFVELVIDAGQAAGGNPSTVVRVEEGRIRILREGAISREEMAEGISR